MSTDTQEHAVAHHPPAIAMTGLRKAFADHVVLDDIDLDVAEGTVFALLGPKGAGKTTMIQILSTLISADAVRHVSPASTLLVTPMRSAE
jgi:ABC-type sugar transport system ATPase subunit